jgi:hypothetical protein
MSRSKAINQLARELRLQGELPRSLGEVKRELRKSGEILPPYDVSAVGSYERKVDEPITPVEYGGLQAAYDHFNHGLFDGTLVDVFITYQRHAHSYGYFAPDRFSGRIEVGGRHELALNPDHFVGRSDEDICATLVHEMVHVWQQQHGKPGSRGYHNKQWAAKMKAVGLQPSNTGGVGGKETGQQMHHYIIADGPFARSYEQLRAKGWKLNLQSAMRANPTAAPKNKTKFTCGECGQNVWGKPDTKVDCHHCKVLMHDASAVQSYDQAAE